MTTAALHRPQTLAKKGASSPRTAFVLSGGASLGALQVGMLRALYARGIQPDLLVGTSVGALNAAFIASRPQTVETADQLADIWCRLRRDDVFPLSVRALIVGLVGRRDHLVPGGAVRRLVREHVEFTDIEHAAIPLHVVAFDTDEQAEVLLSAGPAVDAITAAASIPGVFPSVRVGERSLIDGGVTNNTPLSHAVALGAERVFILPTRDPRRPPARASRGALGAAIDGLGVLTDARLQFDLQRFSTDAELIVLPCPNADGVQPTNFDHASTLIQDAFDASHRLLAQADRVRPYRPRPRRQRTTQRPPRVPDGLSQAA
jgi:NTE family protein